MEEAALSRFVSLCLALVAASAAATEGKRAAPNERPNVIFILADDLGWGDLSCTGNSYVKTPHLDQLASRGTLFTSFYVSSPVCSSTSSVS